jgi:hypothetical protein
VNFILFEVVIEAAGESSFQKIMDELTAEDFYSAYPVMGQHCSEYSTMVGCSLVQSLHKNTRCSVSFMLYRITGSAYLNLVRTLVQQKGTSTRKESGFPLFPLKIIDFT